MTSSRTKTPCWRCCGDGALTLVVAPPAPPAPRRARVRGGRPRCPRPAPTPRRSARTRSPCCAARCPGARRRTSRWSPPRAAKDGATLRCPPAPARAGHAVARVQPQGHAPASRLALAEGVRRGRRPDRHRGRASARGDQDRRGARGRARGAPGERVPPPRAEAAARTPRRRRRRTSLSLPRWRRARRRRTPSSRRRRDAVTLLQEMTRDIPRVVDTASSALRCAARSDAEERDSPSGVSAAPRRDAPSFVCFFFSCK